MEHYLEFSVRFYFVPQWFSAAKIQRSKQNCKKNAKIRTTCLICRSKTLPKQLSTPTLLVTDNTQKTMFPLFCRFFALNLHVYFLQRCRKTKNC